MPQVLSAGLDVDPLVRECACFALGQAAEFCQPEIIDYSQQILPVVFRLLDDPSISVQTTSCYVLEMFCEHLQVSELVQNFLHTSALYSNKLTPLNSYLFGSLMQPSSITSILKALMEKLVGMLQQATRKCVREMAVAAIAAVAIAAEKEFIPYLHLTTSIMVSANYC